MYVPPQYGCYCIHVYFPPIEVLLITIDHSATCHEHGVCGVRCGGPFSPLHPSISLSMDLEMLHFA